MVQLQLGLAACRLYSGYQVQIWVGYQRKRKGQKISGGKQFLSLGIHHRIIPEMEQKRDLYLLILIKVILLTKFAGLGYSLWLSQDILLVISRDGKP
jgi:hypothetical protein